MSAHEIDVDIVVPTLGRPSLAVMLDALGRSGGPAPRRVIVVDDRSSGAPLRPLGLLADRITVLQGPSLGPAAARNAGWRAGDAEWVAFLGDDVVPPVGWLTALAADLAGAGAEVGGSQGGVRVPLPHGRRPTDWERSTRGLETAPWSTVDMAYRRSALEEVGGFDERFRRASREDADLALRVLRAGRSLVKGSRWLAHPVRPSDRWASLRAQRGNADDSLMRSLHGRRWRRESGAARGRRPLHLATTAGALVGLGGAVARRPGLAALGFGAWLAGTVEFAARRIAPGPRTRDEVRTMLATSALIPPAATLHTLRGVARWRVSRPAPWPSVPPAPAAADPAAVSR